MSPESSQEDVNNEGDKTLSPEVLERIKHPPAIDDMMLELSPQELLSNPAVAPQMIDEQSDLRDDLRRD